MKTILAPIDFSESSKLVIDEAATLARALDARLVLLHVIQPLPASASEFGFAEVTAKIAGAAMNNAAERLTHIQRQLSARRMTTEIFHVTGVPGAVIVSRAQEFHASYIVIGSHGHGALYELIIGSTASRVIKEATCPVVVVQSHAQPSQDALSLDLEPTDVSEEAQRFALSDQR